MMKRRRELLKLGAADQESVKPLNVDQTSEGRLSRMDALQSQAMELEFERRRHHELQRIESALIRIEEGDYGYCAVCGDEIAVKRLRKRPDNAGLHQLRQGQRALVRRLTPATPVPA